MILSLHRQAQDTLLYTIATVQLVASEVKRTNYLKGTNCFYNTMGCPNWRHILCQKMSSLALLLKKLRVKNSDEYTVYQGKTFHLFWLSCTISLFTLSTFYFWPDELSNCSTFNILVKFVSRRFSRCRYKKYDINCKNGVVDMTFHSCHRECSLCVSVLWFYVE